MKRTEYKKLDIIDSIVKMRLEKGASSKTIIQDYLKGQLGFGTTYAYELYKIARKKIVELYSTKNEELANEALGQLEFLYEDAILTNNMKLALEIRKEINKLTGIYAAEKMDITSNGNDITEIKLIHVTKKDDNNE